MLQVDEKVVNEKVAIGAVKDSCRLIEEEEVEVRPEKLPDDSYVSHKKIF